MHTHAFLQWSTPSSSACSTPTASTANLVFFYSVAVLNASGALVRMLGNSLADLYGPSNVQVACSIGGDAHLGYARHASLFPSLIFSSPPSHLPPGHPSLPTPVSFSIHPLPYFLNDY
jgi:hypothetical protein